jgi:hypothetical protein
VFLIVIDGDRNYEQPILARIIELFVLPARRQRLMGFLHAQKRYSQFLDELLHDARHIDSRILYEIPSDHREVDKVAEILRQAGVQGEAYLVGHCGPLEDGARGEFYELLKHCCGSMTDKQSSTRAYIGNLHSFSNTAGLYDCVAVFERFATFLFKLALKISDIGLPKRFVDLWYNALFLCLNV